MVKFLVWFKQRFPLVWKIVENINGLLFRNFFASRIYSNLCKNTNKIGEGSFVYRILNKDDLPSLQAFFESQNPEQFKYFQPHTFDRDTLKHLFKNSAFFMMGVFHNDKMVGYFFLRCFINKKCFIGRIVDKMYQGRGISKIMGRILLRTAWASKFRIFSTVSRDNIKSFNSSKSINNFRIVSELDNGFVFIEYIEESEKTY